MAHPCHLASAYGTSRLNFDAVRWGVPKPQEHDFSRKLTPSPSRRKGVGSSWRLWKTLPGSWGTGGPGGRREHIGIIRVLIAATTGEEADIERATAQMERVTIGCDDAGRFVLAR